MLNLKSIVQDQTTATGKLLLTFPWENRTAYAQWLAQTYHMVNHSTRLVALAGGLTPLDRNELHARFVDHSKEERGHQLIAISDLKALGFRIEELPRLAQSAAMYQIQYYWIQHQGPVSFFGYSLALECLAAAFGPEVYRRTSTAHGAKSTVFLKVHSEDDVEHTDRAFKLLATLSETEAKLVVENLEISSELYRGMLTGIVSRLGLEFSEARKVAA